MIIIKTTGFWTESYISTTTQITSNAVHSSNRCFETRNYTKPLRAREKERERGGGICSINCMVNDLFSPCFFVSVSVCLYVSFHLAVWLFLSVLLSVCLSVCLSLSLCCCFWGLFFCNSVCCLCLFLSPYCTYGYSFKMYAAEAQRDRQTEPDRQRQKQRQTEREGCRQRETDRQTF